MPNTNVLEGIECPKCGYTDLFEILVNATLLVDATDAGYWFGEAKHCGDEEWLEITCPECHHHDKPEVFRKGGESDEND